MVLSVLCPGIVENMFLSFYASYFFVAALCYAKYDSGWRICSLLLPPARLIDHSMFFLRQPARVANICSLISFLPFNTTSSTK